MLCCLKTQNDPVEFFSTFNLQYMAGLIKMCNLLLGSICVAMRAYSTEKAFVFFSPK